jgi:hypothetical protein
MMLTCSGEWIAGSGGHRQHNPCNQKADWWYPHDLYAYCNQHMLSHERHLYRRTTMGKIRGMWQWFGSWFATSKKEVAAALSTDVPFALGEEVGHEWGGVVIKIINRKPLAARLISTDPYWMEPINGKQGFTSFKEPILFVKRGELWFPAPAHNLPNFVLGVRSNGEHFFEHFNGVNER